MPSGQKGTRRPAKPVSATGKRVQGFTDEERAAMRERVKEMKAGEADGESVVLAKIATMPEPDRSMAKRVHAIVRASAPTLTPRLWYGMPAYAKVGSVVCDFLDGAKFMSRYATLGFSDEANLDEGPMWPVAYALKELTPADEARIAELVKRAVS